MKALQLFLISVILVAPAFAAEIKVNPDSAAAKMLPDPDMKGPDKLLSAARAGDKAAQLEVGILYEYGYHMPSNEVQALAWYLLAAESSAKAAKHRDRLLSKLPPAKAEEARKISQTLVVAGAKTPKTTTPPASAAEAPEMAAPEMAAPEMAAPEMAAPEPMLEPLPEPIMEPEKQQ